MNELAERAIACKGWRWLPGMLALDTGLRLDEMTDDWEAELPDLSDPSTLGCLLALVREAWEPHRGSDYIVSTMHTGSGWGVGARYGSEGLALIVLPAFDTEAEALVAALEAAP